MRASVLALGSALGCALQHSPAADSTDSDFPPSGIYEVTTNVLQDDCDPAYAPPANWRTQVVASAEADRAKVNVATSAIPPATSTTSASRSDFVLEQDFSVHRTLAPDRSCEDYEIDYEHALTRFDARGFTVTTTASFGDAGSCAATTMPSSCTTKVSYDYLLVESQCAAECTRGARSTTTSVDGPPTMEIDCRCPQ